MGSGDGTGPGHNALKNQVVGFLFAAQYMRGACHLGFIRCFLLSCGCRDRVRPLVLISLTGMLPVQCR